MTPDEMNEAARDLCDMAQGGEFSPLGPGEEEAATRRVAYETKMLRATLYSVCADICERLDRLIEGQHSP